MNLTLPVLLMSIDIPHSVVFSLVPDLRGVRTIFFVVDLDKKNHNSFILHLFFSKCRQFEGLSTGMFILTISNHTIKLQLHQPRHLIIKKKFIKK